ncbi:DUF4118 domain-containing protein [Dactylosporangium fulvum]|uniref:histidine kinase n=1 Tax=Dactylosporangium fulvum TaxID=53359 RepID=A0ABY5WBL5_9ACTN|nr:DUF4118 domain-containing protein [Dactylosporangium fulvum]UWP86859.1 DUF4118 domain-containing protein [Dactylosporangium fulvum]
MVAILLIAVETLLAGPLQTYTKQSSPSVIYMLGIVAISVLWGLWLGVVTALVSVVAFLIFYVHPIGSLVDADLRDVVQLAVFVVVALVTSALADLSRQRTAQAQESDLTAELTRLLLDTDDVAAVLPAVSQRIARSLDLPATAVDITTAARQPGPGSREPDETVPDGAEMTVFPLGDGDTVLGTLRVSADLSERDEPRLRRQVVPPLASLLRAARERGAMLETLTVRGEKLELLAGQQAALRRVATLVARGANPAEVFDAVTTEVSRLLGGRPTTLMHYEPDGTVTIVSTNQPGVSTRFAVCRRPADGDVAGLVWRTGRTARIDSCTGTPHAARIHELGICAAVGVPIVVEDHLWGTAVVTSMRPDPMPPDAEERVKAFTDLTATAIANADSRAQLVASRARLVTAADEARQRIERNLHDGAQQQLVAISLELRAAEEASTPADQVQAQLAHAATSLNDVVASLRELARGIHPAVLTTGGLKPALKALARRSAVPVTLHLDNDRRLPRAVEIAAYYVVSEALTNAAKHAHASVVHIEVRFQPDTLQLAVHDDGVGGANPAGGSGLTGLQDRVEALGGHMTMTSPPGSGTSLLVIIPIGTTGQAVPLPASSGSRR